MATELSHQLSTPDYLALQAASGWSTAVELIRGEAVVVPPAGGYSASVQGELFYALRRWQDTSGDRGLVLQDVFVRLGPDEFLAPDIAWWHAERRPPLASGALEVVPDLVVEVLSPATRTNDLGPKRQTYISAGVRELWLADPTTATLEVVSGDGRTRTLDRENDLVSGLLAGFSARLLEILPPLSRPRPLP